MRMNRILAGLLALLMVLALTACGAADETQPLLDEIASAAAQAKKTADEVAAKYTAYAAAVAEAEAEAAAIAAAIAAEEAAMDRIGEETDSAYRIKLQNSTGTEITAVAVRVNGESFSETLMAEEDIFEDGEKVFLCVEPAEAVEDEDGNLAEPVYDIQITLGDEDETVWVLHAFPFDDIQEGELCLTEDGVAYTRYVSAATAQTVDMAEAETLIHEEEEEARRKAEEEAAKKASSSSSSSSSNYSYSNSDGCLSDALFW